MAKTQKAINKIQRLIVLIGILAATLVIGIFCCIFGFNTNKLVTIKYDDSSSYIDYRVCYSDNDSPFVDVDGCKSSTPAYYVANLIENIPIDFHYVADFNHQVSGDINYQLVAIVKAEHSGATTDGDSQFGEHSYPLMETKTIHIADADSFAVDESINLDYQYYNSILRDFRKYAPSAQGDLEVRIIIKGKLDTDAIYESINLNTTSSIHIPLAEQAVNISLSILNDVNADREFDSIVDIDTPLKIVARILGIILIAAAATGGVVVGLRFRELRGAPKYEDNIGKILSAYDSIIVTVKDAPSTRGIFVNEILDFDDMLDVYNAVHMPINFYQTKTAGHFMIINGNLAWRYTVKVADYRKTPRRKNTK